MKLWTRFFRRSDALSEAIERAVEDQAEFERKHPVPYDAEIRARALTARAERAFGGRLPPAGVEMIRAVAGDWARAAKAAERTP